jgi:hypothetical protein
VNASTLGVAATANTSDLTSALFPYETIQLTDEIVTNMTNINLTNASLFAFDIANETGVGARANSSPCKVFPGDQAWPSPLVWWIFDLLLGDRLIKTTPLAAPCYNDWPAVENAAECTYITDEWTNSTLQYSLPTSEYI